MTNVFCTSLIGYILGPKAKPQNIRCRRTVESKKFSNCLFSVGLSVRIVIGSDCSNSAQPRYCTFRTRISKKYADTLCVILLVNFQFSDVI